MLPINVSQYFNHLRDKRSTMRFNTAHTPTQLLFLEIVHKIILQTKQAIRCSEYLQSREVDISCCITHNSESIEYRSRSTFGLSHTSPFSASLQDKPEVLTKFQRIIDTQWQKDSLKFSLSRQSHGGMCQASMNPLRHDHHYRPLGSRTRVARSTIRPQGWCSSPEQTWL